MEHDPIPPIHRVRHLHVRTTRSNPAMPTDTLTEAVASMEAAWRRLREVLDGPDVAAALVEQQARPRPMSTAPRDGTEIAMHLRDGRRIRVAYRHGGWQDSPGYAWDYRDDTTGWSPVK